MTTKQLKRSDCVFKSDLPLTFRFAADGEEDGKQSQPKFQGIANTGKAMDSYFFGRFVIDFANMRLKQKTGVLADHWSRDRVGFTESIKFTKQGMEVEGSMLLTGESAQEITAQAREGFPFQMSIAVVPSSVEEFGEGKTVTVNGRKFSVPISVLRDNELLEVSFTSLGRDSDTEAEVFNRGNQELEVTFRCTGEDMGDTKDKNDQAPAQVPLSKETLKASHADVHDAVKQEGFQEGAASVKHRFNKLLEAAGDEHKDKAYELAMSDASLEECFAQMTKHVAQAAKQAKTIADIEHDTTEPVPNARETESGADGSFSACATLADVEARAKSEWAKDPALRAEFFTFEGYLALCRREHKKAQRT